MVREQGAFQTIYGPGGLHPACLDVEVLAVNELVELVQQPPAQLSWLFLLTEPAESRGLAVLGRRKWGRIAFLPLLTLDFLVIEAFALGFYRRWCESQPRRCSLSLPCCLGTSSSSVQCLQIFYDKKGFDCFSVELERKCLAFLFVSVKSLITAGKLFAKTNSSFKKMKYSNLSSVSFNKIGKKIIFSFAYKCEVLPSLEIHQSYRLFNFTQIPF